MDENHAENTYAPQRIQLPNAVFFRQVLCWKEYMRVYTIKSFQTIVIIAIYEYKC